MYCTKLCTHAIEVIFNGIMLVVGTIVGAVWGRQNG